MRHGVVSRPARIVSTQGTMQVTKRLECIQDTRVKASYFRTETSIGARRVTVRRVSHGNQQHASSQSWDRVMMAAQSSVGSSQCVRPPASPSFPHFLFLRPSYRRDRRQYVSTLSVRPCVRMSCDAFPTCLPSISSVFISQ